MKQSGFKHRHIKILAIFFGIFVLICIYMLNTIRGLFVEEEGIFIERAIAMIQLEKLFPQIESETFYKDSIVVCEDAKYLTYEQITTFLEGISFSERLELSQSYKESQFFLESDWYLLYDRLLKVFDAQGSIQKRDVVILGNEHNVMDAQGTNLGANQILTNVGIFYAEDSTLLQYMGEQVIFYEKEGNAFSSLQTQSEEYCMKNIWIVETVVGTQKDYIQFLQGEYLITLPSKQVLTQQREQVADLFLKDGEVQNIICKQEKISGKILSVTDSMIELEGIGKLPISDEMTVYKLYGMLQRCALTDLKIGYAFTDFVLEENKISSCLITREGAMENIRVLVKNNGFAENYHESVTLTVDTDYTVTGNGISMDKKAGEVLEIKQESEWFVEGRILIQPRALTGKVSLQNLNRAQGVPAYRGILEIEKTDQGFVLVNELLLEEYLYAVVPSEMPASYPVEALKAQAICARTYAYRSMIHSGRAAFGAHVDDSTAYQVYNNITENSETTKAVKETQGQLLYYQEDLAGTYYYSTSCGFGTTAEAWSGNKATDFPYLQSKHIAKEGGDTNAITSILELGSDESITNYLQTVSEYDYEKEEAWYRWEFQTAAFAADTIMQKLRERYTANPTQVLTQMKDGSFESKELTEIGDILDLQITKRNPGGNGDILTIQGTKNTIEVHKEYNIRYVLSDNSGLIIKQDGSTQQVGTLLPSAYIIIQPQKEAELIVGYHIRGGGYGHGVGMSQNAAKAMANDGMSGETIVTFFYEGSDIKTIY